MNNLHISLNNLTHASRVLKETKSLVSHGRVDYVYMAGMWDPGLPEREIVDDKREINRIPLSSRGLPPNLFFQLIKYLELMFRLLFRYRKHNIAMVNCHCLSSLPVGVLMKFFYGARLVFDAHELETERNGLHGVRKKLSKVLERLIIRFADLTIVVGPAIADHYQKKYGRERPAVVMNCPHYKEVPRQDLFRENLNISPDQKIFLYQGNLLKGRGIEKICEAFASLPENDNVVVIMGYGVLEGYIREIAEKSPNVFFHPAVPPDVVLNYTASADVGMCLIEPVCLSYYYSLPNKLFEYMMVGLPLIVLNSYEQEKLVAGEDLGLVLEELTVEEIQKAIKAIKSRDYYQENIKRMASVYNWEEQEKIMIDAYDKMLAKTN